MVDKILQVPRQFASGQFRLDDELPRTGTEASAMWRLSTIIVILGAVLLFPSRLVGQSPPRSTNLLTRSNVAQFEIVNGRLMVSSTRPGTSHSQSNKDEAKTVPRQSLTINLQSGVTALHYESESVRERMRVEFPRTGEVEILREPVAGVFGTRSHFLQQPNGHLRWALSDDRGSREFIAKSLWHLLIAEPEVTREHLIPLLHTLRPGWQLNETTDAICQNLWQLAAGDWDTEAARVQQLIRDLSHAEFKTRQSAQRELRRQGATAISHLTVLDPTHLDAEQLLRVKTTLATLKGGTTPDTPPRVAAWLSADKLIWLTLLQTENEDHRLLAVERLNKLTGQTLPFDLFAPTAIRQSQITQLHKMLDNN